MRERLIALAIAVVVIIGGGWWWFGHSNAGGGPLVIYGNVDQRPVDLAFIDSGRIAQVLVDEGANVKQGDVLARLETSRLEAQIAQAEAQVAGAAANARIAKLTYDRLGSLSATSGGGSAVTRSQVDTAEAASDAAAAQLKATSAALALLHQQQKDAELRAPINGVVRSRLLEPGEMATAQRPVFSIAVVQPKWVRAYVSETDLTRVRPNMSATITVDGGKQRTFSGHVGFISSVAEFTPRAIQTTELRTSLVYEVRVLVDDPNDDLRLGMPATVQLNEDGTVAGS